MTTRTIQATTLASAFVTLTLAPAALADACPINAYEVTTLVANRPEFEPVAFVDEMLVDAWAVVIPPAGYPGQIWVSATGTGMSTAYFGDVDGIPFDQSHESEIFIPKGDRFVTEDPEAAAQPTGQAWAGFSPFVFMIPNDFEPVSAEFIWVGLDGVISAWAPGLDNAVKIHDFSLQQNTMYTGCDVGFSDEGETFLYTCDFSNGMIRVYDSMWNEITLQGDWDSPDVPDLIFAPFNIRYMEGNLYIAWAFVGDEDGEEDHYPGYGFVSEFDWQGNHIRTYEHVLELNAPWGLAIAPDDFGIFSGDLIVSNFADGAVLAFDRETTLFKDYLRGNDGQPILIDGIWGMAFGNGELLGTHNHLYWGAGPNAEEDGTFGKIAPSTLALSPDLDANGTVNAIDLSILLSAFGKNNAGDVNNDGITNAVDLGVLLAAFNTSCN